MRGESKKVYLPSTCIFSWVAAETASYTTVGTFFNCLTLKMPCLGKPSTGSANRSSAAIGRLTRICLMSIMTHAPDSGHQCDVPHTLATITQIICGRQESAPVCWCCYLCTAVFVTEWGLYTQQTLPRLCTLSRHCQDCTLSRHCLDYQTWLPLCSLLEETRWLTNTPRDAQPQESYESIDC